MKFNFLKILFLFTAVIIVSCSSTKISAAEKFIQYPGVPSGTPFISYKVTFNVDTDFSIKKVALSKEGDAIMFAIQNLKTLVYVNPKSSLFTKGAYQLTFKNNDISKINELEEVYILIEVNNNNNKWLTHKFETKKAFHSR